MEVKISIEEFCNNCMVNCGDPCKVCKMGKDEPTEFVNCDD